MFNFEQFWINLWGKHLPTQNPPSPPDFGEHPDRITTPKALAAQLDELEARLERQRLAVLEAESYRPPPDKD